MTEGAVHKAGVKREFLGWDRPALPEAARRLASAYRQGRTLDLGRVIVVVPGQRAGRRLLELLAFLAEDETLCLTPPEVATQGRLPDMLYPPKQPFADDIVQDLAWAKALRDLPVQQRQHVVPHPPAEALGWLRLGSVLRRLHVELAGDGVDFEAVRRAGPKLADFGEGERWTALVELQRRYHGLLDAEKLWDVQTARLKAIEFREIQAERDIVLLGTADLNNCLRQMLDQVAERVTAYIIAPESLADRFDTHGCLVPGKWSDVDIGLQDEQLEQVDGPEEQADAVAMWLAKLDGRFGSDEITIGVPDESLVPQLQWQLQQCGVRPRWVEGVRVAETAPYRLLKAAAQFADGRRYDDLAALVRHPDMEDWLESCRASIGAGSLLAQLDQFYNRYLPSRIDGVVPNDRRWPDLPSALQHLQAWLKDAGGRHLLRIWGDVFCRMLGAVYASRAVDLSKSADEILHGTLDRILQECDRLAGLPAMLDTEALSASEAFRIALGPLGDTCLPPPADPDAVEILGWLELPLDDAAVLIVTSFNEGFVPQSAGADAFLPDRLRRELQLDHNERRYARDAYAASVLAHGGKELRILLARRDTKKEPLQPSRLLFACPEDELTRRAQRFFQERRTTTRARRLLLAPVGSIPSEPAFAPPPPDCSGRTIEQLRVTDFKAYLACRYRYYLRHVRGLEAIDDAAREMDGGVFGSLLHKVLGAFGRDRSGPRSSEKERDILDFLVERLRKETEGVDHRRPAVRLQMEQARRRLATFAAKQVSLVREGWRIVYAEDDDNEKLSIAFATEGGPIQLVGRIDRIDFNESRRVLRIVDYKTADNAEVPDKTHRKKDRWVDLQLPLYRHLWRAARLKFPEDCPVELGYFNLPKKSDASGVEIAPWNEVTLENADATARQVIRNIRAGEFWPPEKSPKYAEDLAAICLDNVRCAPDLGDDEEASDEP